MVRLQIVSDVHIEVKNKECNFLDFVTPEAEILILAGDIGSIYKYSQLKKFLSQACEHYKYVLYVLGNHEYYHIRGIPKKTMFELHKDIFKMRDEINIECERECLKILTTNDGGVLIGNICIIGCTLWSEVKCDFVPKYIVRINELNGNKKTYNSLHKRDVDYIQRMIAFCQRPKNNYRLVVVTHHAPSNTLNTKHKKDKFRSLYTTDLDYMMGSENIHTWICGHLHTNFDLHIKGTRLVGNQKGKDRDHVENFSMNKIIEF